MCICIRARAWRIRMQNCQTCCPQTRYYMHAALLKPVFFLRCSSWHHRLMVVANSCRRITSRRGIVFGCCCHPGAAAGVR